VTYTPNADFSGTDSFQYRVADTEGLTDTATVRVTVRNINDPPTITPIPNQTIAEDGSTGALSFTVGDEETAPAALSVTAGSSNTTLVPNANLALGGSGANRSITVTPAANQNGSTNITVTVSDGGESASTSFTVTVTAVPDPPVAEDDNATTPVDTDVTIDVLANDVGVDAALDRSSVTVTSGPANGTTSVNPGNGRVTYTPNADFARTDSFQYRVADAEGLTDTATVTITVGDRIRRPVVRRRQHHRLLDHPPGPGAHRHAGRCPGLPPDQLCHPHRTPEGLGGPGRPHYRRVPLCAQCLGATRIGQLRLSHRRSPERGHHPYRDRHHRPGDHPPGRFGDRGDRGWDGRPACRGSTGGIPQAPI
jgi:hypothetical protein